MEQWWTCSQRAASEILDPEVTSQPDDPSESDGSTSGHAMIKARSPLGTPRTPPTIQEDGGRFGLWFETYTESSAE